VSALVERVRGSWCTPPEIVGPLHRLWPIVGLDPCSNERSIVKAVRTYTIDDGLEPHRQRWAVGETVYFNPDFADTAPWVTKASGHIGGAIGCVLCDPSVSWWERVWTADAICFPRRRIAFLPPPGVRRSSFPRPIALPFWSGMGFTSVADFEHAFRDLGKVVRL
jgi:hypothetical protein